MAQRRCDFTLEQLQRCPVLRLGQAGSIGVQGEYLMPQLFQIPILKEMYAKYRENHLVKRTLLLARRDFVCNLEFVGSVENLWLRNITKCIALREKMTKLIFTEL